MRRVLEYDAGRVELCNSHVRSTHTNELSEIKVFTQVPNEDNMITALDREGLVDPFQ